MKYICYNEGPLPPDGEDGGVTRLTVEEVVKRQKEVGRLHNFEYPTDQDAVDDFMVCMWAWEEELLPVFEIGDAFTVRSHWLMRLRFK